MFNIVHFSAIFLQEVCRNISDSSDGQPKKWPKIGTNFLLRQAENCQNLDKIGTDFTDFLQ